MNSFINSALIILLELSVNPSDYTDIAIHFTSYYSKAYAAIEYELEHHKEPTLTGYTSIE